MSNDEIFTKRIAILDDAIAGIDKALADHDAAGSTLVKIMVPINILMIAAAVAGFIL